MAYVRQRCFPVEGEQRQRFCTLASYWTRLCRTTRHTSGAAGGVSRCGLAVRRLAGKQKDHGSIRFGRLSFLFKSCGLWTLSCDFSHTINETLKWLTQLPTLMQNHSGGDSVASTC